MNERKELLEIHQSKPMRVKLKEPVELEPMKKIGEISDSLTRR